MGDLWKIWNEAKFQVDHGQTDRQIRYTDIRTCGAASLQLKTKTDLTGHHDKGRGKPVSAEHLVMIIIINFS